MATPTNPYYSQIYSPSLMTWGDQEAGSPVFSGKYNITPYSGDFNAWAKEYTDPAYRANFAYADPGYDGGAGMGVGTKTLNALPSLWSLGLSGYFNQFGQLTPEQQEWLGSNIAREQHISSGNNVIGGLGADDLAVLSVLAAPFVAGYSMPASAEGAAAGAYGGMDAAAVAGADYGAAAGGAAAGGSAMPAAIAEADPTFGGLLTQTSPGVYAAGGTPMMPAAIPEADPTFGGELTQTSAGGFENLGNTSEFGGGLAPSSALGGGALAANAASGASGGGGSSGGGSGGGTAGTGAGGGLFDLADDEWLRRLSYGIPGLLGAIGAGAQAEDFEDLSHQYQQMGAPYRSRLEQLYANPQAFLDSPEVRQPIQQGTDMLARSLSVKGNPAGSGNALQELQNYASTQLFNRLGQEKDRLGGFGGLTAYNQAAPQAASNALSAQGNIYSNLGGATADIFNPPRRYDLRDFMRNYA